VIQRYFRSVRCPFSSSFRSLVRSQALMDLICPSLNSVLRALDVHFRRYTDIQLALRDQSTTMIQLRFGTSRGIWFHISRKAPEFRLLPVSSESPSAFPLSLLPYSPLQSQNLCRLRRKTVFGDRSFRIQRSLIVGYASTKNASTTMVAVGRTSAWVCVLFLGVWRF